jgi:hypothetical protein
MNKKSKMEMLNDEDIVETVIATAPISFPDTALSISRNQNGIWEVVEIGYNSFTGQTKILARHEQPNQSEAVYRFKLLAVEKGII